MIQRINIPLRKQYLAPLIHKNTSKGMASVEECSVRYFDRFAQEVQMALVSDWSTSGGE